MRRGTAEVLSGGGRRLRGRVALRLLVWSVALCGTAGAAPAVDEVEFIRLTGDSGRAVVRILSSGRPAVVGSQLDQDGVLVIELAGHRPSPGLTAVRRDQGLVEAVDVGVHQGQAGVATRILIRTRSRAAHTVSLDGSLIHVALRRLAGEPAGGRPATRQLEERIQTTSAALAESEQSRALLVGQIEAMSNANRQLVQLFEELEGRRGQLEAGLETARQELIRLREERSARDQASARRLQEIADRETSLASRVERLTAEAAEAETARSELANRLRQSAAERQALEGRLEAATRQEAELSQRVEELATQVAASRGSESELADRLRESAAERQALEGRLEAATTQEAELSQQVEELATQVAVTQGSESELARRLDEAGAEREQLAVELAEVSAERRALLSRAERLEAEGRRLASSLGEAESEVARYRAGGLVRGRTTANVNLRGGPGLGHEVLGSLPAESVAEVLSRGDQWLRVRLGNRQGWVAAEYFAFEEDELSEARLEVRELTRRLEESAAERSGLEDGLQAKRAQEAELQRRVEELAAQVVEAQGSEGELTRRLQETGAERDQLAARLTAVSGDRQGLEERSRALEAERRELAGRLEQAQDEIERYRSRGLVRGRATATLNLRAGPGTDHEVLGSLSPGTVAEVVNRGDEWLQVRVGDRQGWVAAEYFALEEDELSEARLRVAHLTLRLEQSTTERAGLEDSLQAKLEREVDLQRRVEELATQLTEARGSEGELDSRLAAAQAREADLTSQLEDLTSRFGQSRGSEEALTRQLQEVVGEQARMADRLVEAAAREEDLVRRMAELTAEVTQARGAELELERRLDEADGARRELEVRLEEAMGRDRALEGRVAELTAELEEAARVESDLDRRLAESGADRADLEARLTEVGAARAALAREVDSLTSQRRRLTVDLEASQRELGRYREQGLLRGRATSNVNLRAGAGVDFERLGLLPAGTVAEVLNRGVGWFEVRSAGRAGWVSGDYFRLEGDELSELSQRVAELESRLGRSQADTESLTDRLARVTAERDSLAAEVVGARDAVARSEAADGARLQELAARLAAAEGREQSLGLQVEDLGRRLRQANADGERLAARLEGTEAGRSELADTLTALEAERAALRDQVGSLTAENRTLGAELEEAVGAVQSYREQGVVRARTTAGVNLRTGPGLDFERIVVLPVETVAEVLNRGEGWIKVRAADRVGWVSGDYLQLENDELSALRGEVGTLRARVGQMERAGQDLLLQLEAAQDGQTVLEERLATTATSEQGLAARVAELDRQLVQAAAEGRRLEESVTRAEGEKQQLTARLETVSEERGELGRRVGSLEGQRAELEARVESLSGELETTRGALDRLTAAPEPAPPSTSDTERVRGPRAAVEAWATAWSNRNVDRYLSFYAREFEPADGTSRSGWEEVRRARISRPNRIQVELSDLQIRDLAPGRAVVSFVQQYESDLFQDRVGKVLELVSEDGRWKIVRESIR